MKTTRLEIAKTYIIFGVNWTNVIFSDEKIFTTAGIDSHYCWLQDGSSPRRISMVLKSPSLMIWAMIMPNGLLAYEVLQGKQNLMKYIELIKNKAIPIINLNYKNGMIFQQENAPIYMAKTTSKFLNESNLTTIRWPPYSPDLNIIENI